jgi:GxxExxY protein
MLKKGLKVQKEVSLPIVFEDIKVDSALRFDFLVEDRVVIELKAVEVILPVHEAQLLTYLKLSGHELGLLINFNVPILKKGIKRIVLSKKASLSL